MAHGTSRPVTTSLGEPAGIGARALALGGAEDPDEAEGVGLEVGPPEVGALVVGSVPPSSSGAPHPARAQVRASTRSAGDVR